MRTNYTSEIDGALAGRNSGSRGYWEVARSGNGSINSDLLAEDGQHYTELEGLGEAVEEMDQHESRAEDTGNHGVLKPYREPNPGEQPPHAPNPGMAWIRRRIRMQSRRPGGNRLVRLRWVQVSPTKYQELQRKGLVKSGSSLRGLPGMSGLPGMGFVDISSDLIKGVALGAGAMFAYYIWKKRAALRA
jgi:hypothetical protein